MSEGMVFSGHEMETKRLGIATPLEAKHLGIATALFQYTV